LGGDDVVEFRPQQVLVGADQREELVDDRMLGLHRR